MLALCLVLFLAGQSIAYSQKPKKGKPVFSQSVAFNRDSIVVSDSIKAIRDSLHRVDSLFKVDSAAMQKHSSLEFPAFSTAKDSVVDIFANGQRKRRYYGDVTVTYGDMKLTAAYLFILLFLRCAKYNAYSGLCIFKSLCWNPLLSVATWFSLSCLKSHLIRHR